MSDMNLEIAIDLLRKLVSDNAAGNTEEDLHRVERMHRAFTLVCDLVEQVDGAEARATRAENFERDIRIKFGKAEQEAKEAHGRKDSAELQAGQLRALTEALQNALRFAEGFIASDPAKYEAYRAAALPPMKSVDHFNTGRSNIDFDPNFRGMMR